MCLTSCAFGSTEADALSLCSAGGLVPNERRQAPLSRTHRHLSTRQIVISVGSA